MYSLSDGGCYYLSHVNVSCLQLLLLKDYLSYPQCIMGRRILSVKGEIVMERFFGFCSSAQPQVSYSSSTSLTYLTLALSPNTAQNLMCQFYPNEVILAYFWSVFPRFFVFPPNQNISIVDVDVPAFPIPKASFLELSLSFMASLQYLAYHMPSS